MRKNKMQTASHFQSEQAAGTRGGLSGTGLEILQAMIEQNRRAFPGRMLQNVPELSHGMPKLSPAVWELSCER